MYYQILIEINTTIGTSEKNRTIKEIDKTNKSEIIQDILVPYLNDEEFIFNGYRLNKKKIIRLKIVTTERSAREISQYENDNMPKGLIMYVSPEDIFLYDKYITDVTKELLTEAKEIKQKTFSEVEMAHGTLDKTKVFIVHGRDNEAKLEVARFVEQMGFKPIILHEQISQGMTVIEKIENYSDAGFGIVLYTPCDIGYLNGEEDKKKPRARQNVVFEHGYLISKLGRNNVCALVKQDIEKPNDIAGVVYIPLDPNGGWKIPLAQEMKSSGYEVDFNQIM